MKKIFTLISVFAIFSAAALSSPAVAGDVYVQLQIPLPGIDRSLPVCTSSGSEYECTGIAQYIAYLYRWLVGIAAVLAVLALTYGGVRWLLSGGESGKIQEAQKIIGSALMGLLIALLSYAALWTINPAFVQFEPLKIGLLKKIDLEIKAHIESHAALDADPSIKSEGVPVSGFSHVKFRSHSKYDAKKDIESPGVVSQLLVDLLKDIDEGGYDVTVSTLVSGHDPGSYHNPGGQAADFHGDRATLVRLAEYLGENSARFQVNELYYAYNTDQSFENCKKQDSGYLKRTAYKETTLYDAHKDHIHVAVGRDKKCL